MQKECTQAEWTIMEILWEQGGMNIEEISCALQSERGWSQNAVRTLLKRMQQKQLVALEEYVGLERYVCKPIKEQVNIAAWPLEASLLERLKGCLAKGGRHQ